VRGFQWTPAPGTRARVQSLESGRTDSSSSRPQPRQPLGRTRECGGSLAAKYSASASRLRRPARGLSPATTLTGSRQFPPQPSNPAKTVATSQRRRCVSAWRSFRDSSNGATSSLIHPTPAPCALRPGLFLYEAYQAPDVRQALVRSIAQAPSPEGRTAARASLSASHTLSRSPRDSARYAKPGPDFPKHDWSSSRARNASSLLRLSSRLFWC
jgi:hypothetical protein